MAVNNILFWLLLLVFALAACTPKPAQYSRAPIANLESAPVAKKQRVAKRYDASLYYPDTNHLDHMPLRQIRINIHFMNTEDTLYRYNGAEGVKYAEQLVQYCNKDLNDNRKNTLMPTGVDVPVLPTRYYLRLVNKPGTDEPAVYFHYDDEEYAYIFNGKNRNIGDREVAKKYGVDLENVLNIFVMAPPRDSLNSKTFHPNGLTGVFLGNFIKVAGFHPKHRPAWEQRGNINHEIGHALGLHHGWLRNDGCDDTRVHTNKCWDRSQSPRCDTMTSNNIMDYSALQNAWTPCQIGRIHARISTLGSKQRKWTGTTWCQPDVGTEIVIDETIVWEGDRDLRKTVRVKAGGRLRINARTHFARLASLIVDPGGTLELGPKAWLHNDCGQFWEGIKVGSQGREQGTFTVEEGARIENTK